MDKNTKEKCPVCGECFAECDEHEIAYCPDCGRPVHAACWQGECPDKDKHGDGYTWVEPYSDEDMPFRAKPERVTEDDGNYSDYKFFGEEPEFIDPDTFYNKVLDEISDPEMSEELDSKHLMGVSARELFMYTNVKKGRMLRFQIFRFMAETGKKVRFGLLSGLLAPYSQLYTGVTGLGILLVIVQTIFSLPNMILMYAMTFPSEQLDAVVNSSGFVSAGMTLSYLSFALTVLLCLFGDYLHLINATNNIKKLRRKFNGAPKNEYYTALEEKGEYRMWRVLLGVGIQLVLVAAVFTVLRLVFPA